MTLQNIPTNQYRIVAWKPVAEKGCWQEAGVLGCDLDDIRHWYAAGHIALVTKRCRATKKRGRGYHLFAKRVTRCKGGWRAKNTA